MGAIALIGRLIVLLALVGALAAAWTDDVLPAPSPTAFNPSLCKIGPSRYVVAYRWTNVSRSGSREMWRNSVYLCVLASLELVKPKCVRWEPFANRYECMWTDGSVGTDTTGPEDAKLFSWPGKGG
jgi:hypothetical protein